MKKNKFIKLFFAFIFLVPLNKSIAQNNINCEIEMEMIKEEFGKDSIGSKELTIYQDTRTIFSCYGYAITKNIGNKKEIFCIIANPILEKADTLRYELKVLAIIHIDTATCELKKEILASQLQSKPTKDLLAEYAINKKRYKKVMYTPTTKLKANYLLRYSYDLMYAAMCGDSLAAERLLFLNKDFKLFRNGLDAEDLTRLRTYLYDLVIVDKPIQYRKRYKYLSLMRY